MGRREDVPAVLGIEGPAAPAMLGDDNRPLTGWRTLRSPEFWLLLVGCIAAVAGVEVWIVVPLLVVGLSIASLPKYVAVWPLAQRAGAEHEWWVTVLLSFLSNFAAGYAAFMAGIAMRWLWW